MSILRNEQIGNPRRAGFFVKYSSSTAVTVTAGSIEANEKFYTLSSDATHNMTSLTATDSRRYIYIDDSASSPPVAVIIDSATAPAESAALDGWYNGADRCIGVVPNRSIAVIPYFDAVTVSERFVRITFARLMLPALAVNMDPSGDWQTPNTNESSVLVPVNAAEIYLRMSNSDVGVAVSLYAASSEFAAVSSVGADPFDVYSSSPAQAIKWIPLGASRNIQISGADINDNFLTAWCLGYGYLR